MAVCQGFGMRPPTTPAPALAALGALLDRSLVEIADAARDARTYDRETVRAVSDLWDNTTYPLFWAASGRSDRQRDRRARAALTWMVRLRPTRWEWMVEQGTVAGHRIDALVRPAPTRVGQHFRDYRGLVRPSYDRWTPEALTALATDYEQGAATVRHIDLERAGTGLSGYLILDLVRSYDPGDDAPGGPAELHVHLYEVTEVDVDTDAAPGARLASTSDGFAIALGAGGALRAREASLHLRDSHWHLSGAGRRADALVPPRQGVTRLHRPPRRGELEGSVLGAANFLSRAVLLIRSVRYPSDIEHFPVVACCRALEGAGRDILAAGALPRRRREAAFRSLTATWLRRGGTELAPHWKRLLRDDPNAEELARGAREDLGGPEAAAPVPGAGQAPLCPEHAQLRMVSYTAEHTDRGSRREAAALAHLALPAEDEGAPWRMRVLRASGPGRLRARTEAFDGAGGVGVDTERNGRQTLVTGGDALTLDAASWSRKP